MADSTIEFDGMTISSNHETADAMRAAFDDVEIVTSGAPAADAAADGTSAAPADAAGGTTAGATLDKRTREGRKQSIQQEINQHKETARLAKEEADRETARLADLRRQREQQERPVPPPVVASSPAGTTTDDPEPDPTDATAYPEGQFDRKYLKDQARWEAKQEFRQQQQQQLARDRQVAHERYTTQVASQFDQRMKTHFPTPDALETWTKTIRPELLTSKPHFAVIPGVDRISHLNIIAEVIAKSETPRELMEYLSDPANADTYQRLSTLPPMDIHRTLGKIEGRFDAARASSPASKPKAISHANPPAKLPAVSPSVSDDVDEDDLPVEEYFKRANARDRHRSSSARL